VIPPGQGISTKLGELDTPTNAAAMPTEFAYVGQFDEATQAAYQFVN
jgi:hypothetical protein